MEASKPQTGVVFRKETMSCSKMEILNCGFLGFSLTNC